MNPIRPAPYLRRCELLAARAGGLRNPAIFHASDCAGPRGRYSVAAAEPAARLFSPIPGAPLVLERLAVGRAPARLPAPEDWAGAVRFALNLLEPAGAILHPAPADPLPFSGGLAGYLAYEEGIRFERMPGRPWTDGGPPGAPLREPSLAFHLYPSAYVADHARREGWYVLRRVKHREGGDPRREAEAALERLREWIEKTALLPEAGRVSAGNLPAPSPDWMAGWNPSLTPDEYLAAVRRVREYLGAGDAYQVNLTVRRRRDFTGSPASLFEQLCIRAPAPYAAYLETGELTIAGASPELLLDVRADGWCETRPIKGTAKARPGETEAMAAARLASGAKERAEHIMIVDLERNDLGRVCRPGTVRAGPLLEVEAYGGAFHMATSVHGRLKPGLDAVDALAAIFPGGSVTGAPKVRAMEIIRELEPVERGVYTGAVGWLTPEGGARFNLPIRTLLLRNGVLDLHAGGGIVFDSDPEAEAEECRIKGAPLAAAAEDAAR